MGSEQSKWRDDMTSNIRSRELQLGVVGLGHVGLPLALLLADAGYSVIGIEIDEPKVMALQSGQISIAGREEGLTRLLKTGLESGNLAVVTDSGHLKSCDLILVCVATPVDEDGDPALTHLMNAVRSVAAHCKSGALVIVESTIPPGTCERQLKPLLESNGTHTVGQSIFLGYSPERIMPGRLITNQLSLPRVCGADDESVQAVMKVFYEDSFGVSVDVTSLTTAELTKVVENTYRNVQIAFANEVALRCAELGVSFETVRYLVNQVPERQLHRPGPGVGGHCIPKDPFLFMAGSTHESHLVRAAHASNSAMPIKFCDRVDAFFAEFDESSRLDESSRTVCLLGYSYLANSGDTRNSPSSAILVELLRRGYAVHVHDPFVEEYSDKLDEKIRISHLSVVLVNHSIYDGIPESHALRFADFMGF